jgi:hypothetical protein
MILETGQRGILVGQTGSGKTQNAIFQLRHAKQWPVIVFDTKIEDDFLGLPEGNEKIALLESLPEFIKYAGQKKKDMHDYIIVRPGINELQDFDVIDNYNLVSYHKFGPAFFYYDELYNWHNRGVAGNGLLAMMTRGRSKGKTMLGSTQRPAWISRFCFTEAQRTV